MTGTPQLPIEWDGLFLTATAPWGASVVVRRTGPDGRALVLIVRRDRGDASRWSLPAAARLPGEEPAACARRALEESVGFSLPLVQGGDLQPGWPTFTGLSGSEIEPRPGHGFDAFDWVEPDEAERRCGADGWTPFALVA